MYEPADEGDELQQGDIIRDLVLPVGYDPGTPALFAPDGEPIDNVDEAFGPGLSPVLLQAAVRSPALIVSQTCDVQHRPFMAVARVIPLSDLDPTFAARATEKTRAEHIDKNYQRPGVQPARFYLQESAAANFPKSAASLLELVSVQNTAQIREYLRRRRILRLVEEAVSDLQFRLAYYFGRYATTDQYMLTEAERAQLPRRGE